MSPSLPIGQLLREDTFPNLRPVEWSAAMGPSSAALIPPYKTRAKPAALTSPVDEVSADGHGRAFCFGASRLVCLDAWRNLNLNGTQQLGSPATLTSGKHDKVRRATL